MENGGGSEQQQQQQQQQRVDRRRRRSTMTAAVTTTTVAAATALQQQQLGGGRRRAVPARRSCSAVTEREMMVAGAWQPSRQHTVAKRSSRAFRESCFHTWNSRVGSQNTNAPSHKVQALFNDLGLYPTSVQVTEMMQCVMKCGNRSSPVFMTFGEFCLLAKKLKNGYRRIPRSVQFSRLLEKDQEKHTRGLKKNSRSAHSYDVFLGGSCNPTTWRRDCAIPYLQEAGISFYNPQVDVWSQDLIEIEHNAKENATILFYVIDSQTRNVSSDIETANFAGYHNNLVLVIHPQDAVTGSIVAGEQISSKEAEDIREALTVLHQIASDQKISVFDNISLALKKVVQILKEKTHQQNNDTGGEDNTTYRKIRDTFNTFDPKASGKIDVFDAKTAIQWLTNHSLSDSEVLNQKCFTFDQFHAIASKYLQQLPDKQSNRTNGFDIGRTATTCRSSVRHSLNSSQECVMETRSPKTTDIYLAGESGDDIRWKDDVAIPMIKTSNLTYHAATKTDVSLMLDARTLLFVIPNNSRSLATMILAAYCIAKSCRMVLCIQYFNEDNCTVRGEKLTETAINDYNRGRKYLKDLATRERVPVFKSITESVENAIQKSLPIA